MRIFLIIIIFNFFSSSAISEISKKTWKLLNKPISIMDWGIMKLKDEIEDRARGYENMSSNKNCSNCNIIGDYKLPPIFVSSDVFYNGQKDKIIIGLKISVNREVDMLELCTVMRNYLTSSLIKVGQDMMKHKEHVLFQAREHFAKEYFSHTLLLEESILDHINQITETKVLITKKLIIDGQISEDVERVLCYGNITSLELAFQKSDNDKLVDNYYYD